MARQIRRFACGVHAVPSHGDPCSDYDLCQMCEIVRYDLIADDIWASQTDNTPFDPTDYGYDQHETSKPVIDKRGVNNFEQRTETTGDAPQAEVIEPMVLDKDQEALLQILIGDEGGAAQKKQRTSE